MTKFMQGSFTEANGRTEEARTAWSKIYERWYVVTQDERGFANGVCSQGFETEEEAKKFPKFPALAEHGMVASRFVELLPIAKAEKLPRVLL